MRSATHLQNQKAKVFFPNLDGIRFVCFFAVFLSHTLATKNPIFLNNRVYQTFRRFVENGSLGVNFFFVLSGFLITFLLITEKETSGKIIIKNFYYRRILRIWPLYYLCIAFGFLVFPTIKKLILGVEPFEPANVWMYVSFLANFDYIRVQPDSTELSTLWSIAVEEQFYLFWPILLSVLKPRSYPYLFWVIIFISIIMRWAHADEPFYLYLHTLSVMSDLALGALAAYYAYYHLEKVKRICNVHPIVIASVYLTALLGFYYKSPLVHANTILIVLERIVYSSLFMFIILEQCYSDRSFFKFSNLKFATFWGKYTYGLYCLHVILILATDVLSSKFLNISNVYGFMAFGLIVPFVFSLIVSYLSYLYFERPFLRIKSKFSTVITHP